MTLVPAKQQHNLDVTYYLHLAGSFNIWLRIAVLKYFGT